MDYIHIDNLIFKGRHGHYPAERKVEQEFLLSLRMGVSAAPAGASDHLGDTVVRKKK